MMNQDERIRELEETIAEVKIIMTDCLQRLATNDQQEDEILSAAEIAEMLGVTTYRVNEDLKIGKHIQGRKIGGSWAVLASKIPHYAEWVKNRPWGLYD